MRGRGRVVPIQLRRANGLTTSSVREPLQSEFREHVAPVPSWYFSMTLFPYHEFLVSEALVLEGRAKSDEVDIELSVEINQEQLW